MSIPSDADVKGWVRDQLLSMNRLLPVIQAATERAESAFSGPDFSAAVSAMDDASDSLLAALNTTD